MDTKTNYYDLTFDGKVKSTKYIEQAQSIVEITKQNKCVHNSVARQAVWQSLTDNVMPSFLYFHGMCGVEIV